MERYDAHIATAVGDFIAGLPAARAEPVREQCGVAGEQAERRFNAFVNGRREDSSGAPVGNQHAGEPLVAYVDVSAPSLVAYLRPDDAPAVARGDACTLVPEDGGASGGYDEQRLSLAHSRHGREALRCYRFRRLHQTCRSVATTNRHGTASPEIGKGPIHRQKRNGFTGGGKGNQVRLFRHGGAGIWRCRGLCDDTLEHPTVEALCP